MRASRAIVLQGTRKFSETCVAAIVKIIAHFAKMVKSEPFTEKQMRFVVGRFIDRQWYNNVR